MTYDEYIRYHLGGDAGVEEKMIASLSTYFRLSRWDSFRLAYYYTTTYHIPSALKLLRNHNTPKSELKFRTDRRYVRIGDNFSRIMKQLSPKLLEDLDRATTTTERIDIVFDDENVMPAAYLNEVASSLLRHARQRRVAAGRHEVDSTHSAGTAGRIKGVRQHAAGIRPYGSQIQAQSPRQLTQERIAQRFCGYTVSRTAQRGEQSHERML